MQAEQGQVVLPSKLDRDKVNSFVNQLLRLLGESTNWACTEWVEGVTEGGKDIMEKGNLKWRVRK